MSAVAVYVTIDSRTVGVEIAPDRIVEVGARHLYPIGFALGRGWDCLFDLANEARDPALVRTWRRVPDGPVVECTSCGTWTPLKDALVTRAEYLAAWQAAEKITLWNPPRRPGSDTPSYGPAEWWA